MAAQIGVLFSNPEALARLVDLTDHTTQAPLVWHLNVSFIVAVGIVVSARIAVRAFITRQLFVDDVLIVAATLFDLGICATSIAATYYGLGQHIWNIPPPLENIMLNVTNLVQLMFMANIFYACAIAFTKLSIILSVLRVFPHIVLRRTLYVTGAIIVGLWVAAIFTTIFQCDPVEAAWDITVTGHCIKFINFLYASAGITIVTDLIVTLAPIPYFWKLNLPFNQKLIVSFLFAVGLFACASSMIRVTFLHGLEGFDITFNLVSSLNWSVIECSLGIICVSVPPLRPLFSMLLPKMFKTHVSQNETQDNKEAKELGLDSPTSVIGDSAEKRERQMDKQLEEYEATESAHQQRLKVKYVEVGIAITK